MMRVFTIPPGISFVDALAAGLLADHGGDPLGLCRVTVLLPTRRAVRSLREAFLRLGGGKPMLLRLGTRGRFLACSGYPECKKTMEPPPGLLREVAAAGAAG